MKTPLSVCVVGLGYIGLPTAAVIASKDIDVIGVDVNEVVVDALNSGMVRIVEPGLDKLVQDVVLSKKLHASLTPEPADIFIIAVPTPFTEGRGPDISFIKAATKSIASVLKAGDMVILESTSPVGTTEKMESWLVELRPDLLFPCQGDQNSNVRIAYCPERVLPGKILIELIENDRIIGGLTERCTQSAIDFYELFVSGSCIPTNACTAEMAKLTENAFRDVNIAFANELSFICDHLAINVWELIELVNHHPRVNVLQPGPGVGGHCIAVDPWFIIESAPDLAKIIRSARLVNDKKPDWVINKVKDAAAKFKEPKIACLGLAFKADIDDLRESPALNITDRLACELDANLFVVEPYIQHIPAVLKKYKKIEFCNAAKAVQEADIVLLLVDHKPFLSIDPAALSGKIVIDTRGFWR